MPPLPTIRLYYNDSKLTRFDARVVELSSWQGRPSAVLDRSAFYPESGGQLSDLGTLSFEAAGGDTATTSIVDVQVDEQGVVHHLFEGIPPTGFVSAHINSARRRVHMSLHTSQHMLSRALLDVAKAETVSSRLGENICTIDIDTGAISDKALHTAEDLVNDVIERNVAVRAFFPNARQLRALPLRRPPKVEENIRVVQIEDFDVSACGGTHCASTAEVGPLHIRGTERYKGIIRVQFNAGSRVRRGLEEESDVLRAIGAQFSCGPLDVAGAIEKLRRELDAQKALARDWSLMLAKEMAASLNGDVVCHLFEKGDREFLRAVAAAVCGTRACTLLLGAMTSEGIAVLCTRSKDRTLDCGAWLKKAAKDYGGRGGGRAEAAEGLFPSSTEWNALREAFMTAPDSQN